MPDQHKALRADLLSRTFASAVWPKNGCRFLATAEKKAMLAWKSFLQVIVADILEHQCTLPASYQSGWYTNHKAKIMSVFCKLWCARLN
jgi:hypothetical protein